jgi:hypothetical protein
VQVFADPEFTQTRFTCGTPGTIGEINVVLHNANFIVAGVDFSIDYPSGLTWLGDVVPDAGFISNEVVMAGNSPTGIAIAWHPCCSQDGSQGPIVLLRARYIWGQCDCSSMSQPDGFVVGGYTPLGKTQPTLVRLDDFQEFPAVGMTSPLCGGPLPVESTTWGRVKALYR